MTPRNESPESRVGQVEDEMASLLAKAVVQFTDEALDGRLKPIQDASNRVASAAEEAAGELAEASGKLDAALADTRRIADNFTGFLRETDTRLKALEDRHRKAVEEAMTRSCVLFDAQLAPLLNQATAATGAVQSMTLALSQLQADVLKRADAHLASSEAHHEALLQATVDRALGMVRDELNPLLGQVVLLVEATGAGGKRLDAASSQIGGALDELRAGPPALKDFLEVAQGRIQELARPQLKVEEELRLTGARIMALETVVARTAVRILAMVLVSSAGIGLILWLLLK